MPVEKCYRSLQYRCSSSTRRKFSRVVSMCMQFYFPLMPVCYVVPVYGAVTYPYYREPPSAMFALVMSFLYRRRK